MTESDASGEVTRLLHRVGAGDESASADLLDLVYDQLRVLAGRMFAGPDGAVTLQPTALVHDAYLKLVTRGENWSDRQHFFAVASMAMRQMLADCARARGTQKRGAAWDRVSLTGVRDSTAQEEHDVVALDAAMTKLSSLNERQGRIVELRFLTGLTVEEVARLLDLSTTTIGEEWRLARAFLRRELRELEQ